MDMQQQWQCVTFKISLQLAFNILSTAEMTFNKQRNAVQQSPTYGIQYFCTSLFLTMLPTSFFFYHWHYSRLWALACRTMSFHFCLSATNSLHLLTPSTWRSLSTSSFHPFLGLPLLLIPSSSWVKIFLGILSSSILSRWPNQLILCPFIHFTIFYPLLISSSSRFVRLFHCPFSYLWPYILPNIFLSKNHHSL